MAARKKRLSLTDEWRDRIRVGMIMNRLDQHIEGKLELSQTQIKAADILLKKTIPDLARSELTGKDGADLNFTIVSAIPSAPNAND